MSKVKGDYRICCSAMLCYILRITTHDTSLKFSLSLAPIFFHLNPPPSYHEYGLVNLPEEEEEEEEAVNSKKSHSLPFIRVLRLAILQTTVL